MYSISFTVNKENMKKILEERLNEFYRSLYKLKFKKAHIIFESHIEWGYREEKKINDSIIRVQREKEEVVAASQ